MSNFIYHSQASGADLHNPKGATVTADVITFNNFPVTPSSAPVIDYEVANKKYVDDNISIVLKADGTVPLTANWDVGAFAITATQFISDIAIGIAPFIVASTTEVANLKAATVTTNANLTGEITSIGNAASLDSITISGKADTTITSADYLLFLDATDGVLKKVDAGELLPGGRATVALDNLIGVSINTSLISDTDAIDDLGSNTYRWKDLYISGTLTGDGNAVTNINGQNIPFSQSGFDAVNLNDAVEELLTKENLWDRSGTTVTPHSINDGLNMGNSGAFYLGASDVDGSWRIKRDGTGLLIERRESGVWTEKGAFLA